MPLDNIFQELQNLLPNLLYTLAQLIYFICACCLQLLDFAQLLFRKIIGLDTYYYDGSVAVNPLDFGDGSSGDLVLQIFQKIFNNEGFSILKTAFISMLILGAILLVITTIVAIIRVEYNPNKKPDGKKDYGKGGIIWNMIKALGAFFAVPVVCYFGIMIGNIALYGIDQASSSTNSIIETLGSEITNSLKPSVTTTSTSTDGTTSTRTVSYDYYIVFGNVSSSRYTPVSSIAMRTCLMQANRVRRESDFYTVVSGGGDTEDATMSFGIFDKFNKSDQVEQTATAIDTVFMLNGRLKTPQIINSNYRPYGYLRTEGKIEYFNRYDVGLVSYYYDLLYFNWPIVLLFIFVTGKILLSMTIGLLTRIYMIFGLLLFSPIAISLWPIDGGNAISSWRKKFVSQVLTAYVAVLALNVFYLIYPIINSFAFFDSALGALDYLFQMFFIMAGLLTIQKFDSTFSEMIGGDKEGLMTSGDATWKSMKEKGGSVIKTTLGAAALAGGAVVGAGKIAMGAGKMINSIPKAAFNERSIHKRENKLAENRKRSAMTKDQLNERARKNVVGSHKYQSNLNKKVDATMDEKLNNYSKMGGIMDKEQLSGLTNNIDNDWKNMTSEQKAAFMPKDEKYDEATAREKYNRERDKLTAALNDRTLEEYDKRTKEGFKEWNVSYNQARDYERWKIDQSMQKDIVKTLKLGIPKGEFGAFTMKKMQKEEKGRDKATIRAAKINRKLDKMDTSGSVLKRSMLNGGKTIGSGISTALGSVGNAFTAKPKK